MAADLTKAAIMSMPSAHSVNETLARLRQLLDSKGVHVFAVVDHSGEAERIGLQMPNTKLILFGNPKAGTPLMLAAPSIALDLPLKILIAEDVEGRVWIRFNSPEFLAERHEVPGELRLTLRSVAALALQVSQ